MILIIVTIVNCYYAFCIFEKYQENNVSHYSLIIAAIYTSFAVLLIWYLLKKKMKLPQASNSSEVRDLELLREGHWYRCVDVMLNLFLVTFFREWTLCILWILSLCINTILTYLLLKKEIVLSELTNGSNYIILISLSKIISAALSPYFLALVVIIVKNNIGILGLP